MHALAPPVTFSLAVGLPRVGDGAVEEPAVLRCKRVCVVGLLALREWGVRVEEVADVRAAALHEVTRQAATRALVLRAGEVRGQPIELGVENLEERPESVLLATVRGRGHKDHVPLVIGCQAREQLVAKLAATVTAERERVGL